MTLQEALAASPVGAAGYPAVQDVVVMRNGQEYWWLGNGYIERSKDVPRTILNSNDWHPLKTFPKIKESR